MPDDLYTWQRINPLTLEQMQGSQSAGIVARLEDLMRHCREDRHQVQYQDLVEVRYGDGGGRTQPVEVQHVPV